MHAAAMTNAARRIADTRIKRGVLAALADDERPRTEADGYAIQKAVHALLTLRGWGMIAGYKVGATAKTVQDLLGLLGPGAGGILANNMRPSGAAFGRADFHSPGVECEIALTLGADLGTAGVPYTRLSVAGAVAACHAGIEVVDNRYVDFRAMGAPSLIADDMFQSGCVLGRPIAPGLDLAALKGSLSVNGVKIGEGRGADLLGHPYEVLAWLANRLAAAGQALRAGHVVMCGSVIQPVWLKDQPQGTLEVVVAFEGLGQARASFG